MDVWKEKKHRMWRLCRYLECKDTYFVRTSCQWLSSIYRDDTGKVINHAYICKPYRRGNTKDNLWSCWMMGCGRNCSKAWRVSTWALSSGKEWGDAGREEWMARLSQILGERGCLWDVFRGLWQCAKLMGSLAEGKGRKKETSKCMGEELHEKIERRAWWKGLVMYN